MTYSPMLLVAPTHRRTGAGSFIASSILRQRSRHALEALALLGQAQRLALIDKQAAAVVLLQKVNVLGDGGLGDAQPLGRASVVHGLA